jgi:hypothetical protein
MPAATHKAGMSRGRRMGRFHASNHFLKNLKEFFAEERDASA